MIRRIRGILQSHILSGNIRRLLLRVNVVVKVTTRRLLPCHHRYRVCSACAPPDLSSRQASLPELQSSERPRRCSIRRRRHLSARTRSNLAVVIFEALDHRFVLLELVFIKADPTSQRGQILIDSTEDSSGISYTLTPLSFQSISLWVQLVENLIVLQQLDLPVPGSP